MADDIAITPGSGATVATDEVSARHYQLIKPAFGADGAATMVSATAGLPGADAGPAWTQIFGVSGARFTSANATTAAAVTDAPTTGQKLVIDDLIVATGSTALQVDFQIETAATVFITAYLPANFFGQITLRGKFKLPTADKKLMVRTSVAGTIAVTAFYHSEA